MRRSGIPLTEDAELSGSSGRDPRAGEVPLEGGAPQPGVLEGLFSRFVEVGRTVIAVEISAAEELLRANPGFAAVVGLSMEELRTRTARDFFSPTSWRDLRETPAGRRRSATPLLLGMQDAQGHPFNLRAVVDRPPGGGFALVGEVLREEGDELARHLQRVNNDLATLARERARQERRFRSLSRDLQAALDDLEHTHWHLKKVQEAMPICMECSRLKGDGSNWQSVVDYLKQNQIFLSHGYCPDCADAYLDEVGAR